MYCTYGCGEFCSYVSNMFQHCQGQIAAWIQSWNRLPVHFTAVSIQQIIALHSAEKKNDDHDRHTLWLRRYFQRMQWGHKTQTQLGLSLKQSILLLEGHRFKSLDSQRPSLSRCCKARTLPVPEYIIYRSTALCFKFTAHLLLFMYSLRSCHFVSMPYPVQCFFSHDWK